MIGGKYGSVAPHIPGMFWSRVVSLFDQRPCERNEHNSTSTQLVTRSRSERDGETLHAGIDTRGVHRIFCCLELQCTPHARAMGSGRGVAKSTRPRTVFKTSCTTSQRSVALAMVGTTSHVDSRCSWSRGLPHLATLWRSEVNRARRDVCLLRSSGHSMQCMDVRI